jgi:hypothetical protein
VKTAKIMQWRICWQPGVININGENNVKAKWLAK